MSLSVIPAGLQAFSAANVSAAESISSAGSADSAAMLGAIAAPLGPIGVDYLGAYGSAQANAGTHSRKSDHHGVGSWRRSWGAPWDDELLEHTLDHDYLGVSHHVDGLARLAELGSLKKDSIVLSLAAEYQLSAAAIVLKVVCPPRVSVDGPMRVIS